MEGCTGNTPRWWLYPTNKWVGHIYQGCIFCIPWQQFVWWLYPILVYFQVFFRSSEVYNSWRGKQQNTPHWNQWHFLCKIRCKLFRTLWYKAKSGTHENNELTIEEQKNAIQNFYNPLLTEFRHMSSFMTIFARQSMHCPLPLDPLPNL